VFVPLFATKGAKEHEGKATKEAFKIRVAEFGFRIYNDVRVSDPRGLRDILAAGARVAPV
jgi:hypothetical protein